MTKIKAKLRKIGNSRGVILPLEVITNINLGEEIEIDVITSDVITQPEVITKPLELEEKKFNTEWCPKHEGSMKGTCGCG